ncbi:MAG: glycosyltransferase [Lachnospiraceae bacterium]|nr:glycosyltransferase [Lachnospiraceae bacterium]
MNDLTLIILNYNSCADTVTCVDKLKEFGRDYRIIVTDNCSNDTSFQDLYDRYGVDDQIDVIKTDHNGGYGYGNNFGMKYAIDKYHVETVGILNPDVLIPDSGVLDTMMDVLYSDPAYGIVGGVIIDNAGNKLLNRSGWNIQTPMQIIRDHLLIYDRFKTASDMHELAPGVLQTDCVAGCFFLAKVSCMQDIGFFDEEMFMYQEESVIGIKCRSHGYKEVIALDAHYYHNHHSENDAGMSLHDKVMATKADYDSLVHICRTYYSPALIPFLWIVERLNRIYLAGCYLAGKIRR